MNLVRDDFIAELFAEMKAEIRGLNHDARLMDLWRASLTENTVATIHYLERDAPASLAEAPAAALAYARASAQRDIPLSTLVRAHRMGLARFLEVAMQYVSLLEPAQRVPTIIELVNRSNRLIDEVADQLIVAYEQEHDRWVSRRSGLQQRWVSEVLACAPIDIQRAEKVLRYRFDGSHIAAVVWVDPEVASRDVVALFDQVHSLIAAGRSLMLPTDDREARLWFSVRSARYDPTRVRTAFESAGIRVRL
ncbi:MAG TPA: PucR family transcriptional regulator, partial [Mycobacterium sp.]|nr:PucR family transcriptional regulator [Mycobacterium sp.]